eukprot:3678710-Pyramimonas_sp.AAC.1
MAEMVTRLEQEPSATAPPSEAARPAAPAQEPPRDKAEASHMDVDDNEATSKHIDEMDATTCREHLKECGVDVPAPGDMESEDDAPALRDQLKRHLSSAQSLAKKLKATA